MEAEIYDLFIWAMIFDKDIASILLSLYFSSFNSTLSITSVIHELMLYDEAYYIGSDNLSNLAL